VNRGGAEQTPRAQRGEKGGTGRSGRGGCAVGVGFQEVRDVRQLPAKFLGAGTPAVAPGKPEQVVDGRRCPAGREGSPDPVGSAQAPEAAAQPGVGFQELGAPGQGRPLGFGRNGDGQARPGPLQRPDQRVLGPARVPGGLSAHIRSNLPEVP